MSAYDRPIGHATGTDLARQALANQPRQDEWVTGWGAGGKVKMADIDPGADIEIHRGFAQVTVRIPLAGHVSQEWLTHYKSLASKRNALPVEAEDVPDRSWIIVRLPATTDRAAVQAVLDAARELISEADASERAPQAAETAAVVRE